MQLVVFREVAGGLGRRQLQLVVFDVRVQVAGEAAADVPQMLDGLGPPLADLPPALLCGLVFAAQFLDAAGQLLEALIARMFTEGDHGCTSIAWIGR